MIGRMPSARGLRAHARSVVVTVAAALLVSSCSTMIGGAATQAGGRVAPSGITEAAPAAPTGATAPAGTTGPTAAVPAGLEKFYSQQLSWGPCTDFARTPTDKDAYADPAFDCAFLAVPLTYENPSGPTVKIAVLRKKATGSDRIGSAVFNPGGPGSSGMSFVASLVAGKTPATLNTRFDLIGFDPRGTGSSLPIVTCQTDSERDASRAVDFRNRTPKEVAAAEASARKIAQECVERTGKEQGIDGATFLGSVGTRNVAKDLDVLRAALGDEKLTYVGFSYGTSIGTVYAEQFPSKVRAMVLDGAVDPNQDPGAELVGQSAGFQGAFDAFAAWCAKQQACVLGSDPAQSTAVYQSLVRPLLDTPMKLRDGRVLSNQDAITGTILPLYSQANWPYLAQALLLLSQGDGAGLMSFADLYDGRDATGHYEATLDAFTAVGCMDNPRMDPATALKVQQEATAAAPFADSGDPPAATKGVCDFWPAAPTLAPHVPKVAGLPTVLVVSTTHDPATPYQSGVNLAKDLQASLLTVDGTTHTAYLGSGGPCVDDIGNSYLIDLTSPPAAATCS